MCILDANNLDGGDTREVYIPRRLTENALVRWPEKADVSGVRDPQRRAREVAPHVADEGEDDAVPVGCHPKTQHCPTPLAGP